MQRPLKLKRGKKTGKEHILSLKLLDNVSKHKRAKTLMVLSEDLEDISLSSADAWMSITGAVWLFSVPVGFLE